MRARDHPAFGESSAPLRPMPGRRGRESDEELGLKLALVSVVLVGAGIWAATRPLSSGSATAAMSNVLIEFYRPWGWPTVAVGLLVAAMAIVIWRRAVRRTRAITRTGVTRADLQRLTPSDFETWCAARLREQGYSVENVGAQGDHGIDLIAELDGERTIVQCKRWNASKTVGEPQIRDLDGAMHDANAVRAMVVTTGYFSEAATSWAEGKPILLWDVERLAGGVQALAPTQVASARAVPTCERCGKDMVRRVNRRDRSSFWGCPGYPKCGYTRPL